jgi:hypothetical protein
VSSIRKFPEKSPEKATRLGAEEDQLNEKKSKIARRSIQTDRILHCSARLIVAIVHQSPLTCRFVEPIENLSIAPAKILPAPRRKMTQEHSHCKSLGVTGVYLMEHA